MRNKSEMKINERKSTQICVNRKMTYAIDVVFVFVYLPMSQQNITICMNV